MSVPDSEPTAALEVFVVRCTCQEIYPAHHQCTGPIFHRDSFDIYRETWYSKCKRRKRTRSFEEDSDEEEDEIAKTTSLEQFVARIRQAWSTLPWSAAARERKRNKRDTSTDEDPDQEFSKWKSTSTESKHAHFTKKDRPSTSTYSTA